MRASIAATCVLLVALACSGCAVRAPAPKPPVDQGPSPFGSFVPAARSVVVVGQEAWGLLDPHEGDFLALDGTAVRLDGRGPADAAVMVPDVVRGVYMVHVVPVRYRPGGPTVGSSGKLWETYTLQYRANALWLQRVDGVTNEPEVAPHFGSGLGLWEPVTPRPGDLVWLTYDKSFAGAITGKLASWDAASDTARIVAPAAIGSVAILDFVDIHVASGLKVGPAGSGEPTASPTQWTSWTGKIDAYGRFAATGVRMLDQGDGVPRGSTVASLAPTAGKRWVGNLSSGAIERRLATLLGEPPRPNDYNPMFNLPGNRFVSWR
jgi:hypothetical protein